MTDTDLGYPANQDDLIRDYQHYAYSLVRPYLNKGLPLEDLQQEALTGLLEAYRNYDPGLSTKFSTYAYYWIRKKILSALEIELDLPLSSEEPSDQVPDQSSASPEDETELSLPDSLPGLERQILILSYEKRLSLNEIAKTLGLRVEKVKQLRQKGLRRLRS